MAASQALRRGIWPTIQIRIIHIFQTNVTFTFFSFSLMLECIFWYGCFGLILKQLLLPSPGPPHWVFPPGPRGRGWRRQAHSPFSPLHSVGPKTQRISLRIPPTFALCLKHQEKIYANFWLNKKGEIHLTVTYCSIPLPYFFPSHHPTNTFVQSIFQC